MINLQPDLKDTPVENVSNLQETLQEEETLTENSDMKKSEEQEELLARSVTLSSTLDGVQYIDAGTMITITATLNGFHEDDHYEISWEYCSDNDEIFHVIEGANDLTYSYPIDEDNAHNIWRIIISLE